MNKEEKIEQKRQQTEKDWQAWMQKEKILPAGHKVHINVQVTVIEDPPATVSVQLPPELQGPQFGRSTCRYLLRELTAREFRQLETFPDNGWPKKFITLIVNNKNIPISRDRLNDLAVESGFQHTDPGSLCNRISELFKKADLPFGFRALPNQHSSQPTCLFRIFRKVLNK